MHLDTVEQLKIWFMHGNTSFIEEFYRLVVTEQHQLAYEQSTNDHRDEDGSIETYLQEAMLLVPPIARSEDFVGALHCSTDIIKLLEFELDMYPTNRTKMWVKQAYIQRAWKQNLIDSRIKENI